jgi:hypothetical protein
LASLRLKTRLTAALALAYSQLANLGGSEVDIFGFPFPACKGIAKTVTVKYTGPKKEGGEGRTREVEWARAAVKESLAAAKYVAPGFKVAIGEDDPTYEVTAIEVSTKVAPKIGPDAVTSELSALSLSDAPVVYEAQWRTKVVFEEETEEGKKAATASSKPSSSTPVSFLFFAESDTRLLPLSHPTSTSSRRPSNPSRRTSSSAASTLRSRQSARSSTSPFNNPSSSRVSGSPRREAYSSTAHPERARPRSRAPLPRRRQDAAASS